MFILPVQIRQVSGVCQHSGEPIQISTFSKHEANVMHFPTKLMSVILAPNRIRIQTLVTCHSVLYACIRYADGIADPIHLFVYSILHQL